LGVVGPVLGAGGRTELTKKGGGVLSMLRIYSDKFPWARGKTKIKPVENRGAGGTGG